MAQSKLEENNLKAQLKLSGDILSNYNTIMYVITKTAKSGFNLVRTKKRNDDESYTFTKDEYNAILELFANMQEERSMKSLDFSCKSAIESNEIKKPILSILQSSI